jgi:hypothetical protein
MKSPIPEAARFPSFHDAKFSGLVLQPNKQCSLFITVESGELHRLTLVGIERLRADDFREGNIILDATAQSGGAVEKAEVLFALSIDAENRHPAFVEATMEKIRRGELILVQLSPSYGCRFSCLCTGWHWDRPASESQVMA